MADVFAFWAVALLVGGLAIPLAARLFRRFPDAGAGLALPLGLALIGWGYFTLRTVGLLSFGRAGYLLAFVLFAAVSGALAVRDRRLVAQLSRALPGILVAIGVFTGAFFSYVAFRSYNPDINGTEMPMDFMYLNATLESPDYPPEDSWLAGERASYYYFGYLQVGVLTEASGIPSSTGYNLGLAYTFAAGAAAAVSLATALARWALGSRSRRVVAVAPIAATLLLLFVGSLSAVFEWTAAHGHTGEAAILGADVDLYGALGLEWMIPCEPGQAEDCYSGQMNPRTSHWYPTEYWFWWRGSRIIPDTITEFPFFSFLLGDLHPHVMSIPLVLLAMALAAAVWRGRGLLDVMTHVRYPLEGVVLALVFGALAFQNTWDVLTFSALLGVAVVVRNIRRGPLVAALVGSVSYLAPVFLLAVVAYIPWYLDFDSQASGMSPFIGKGTRPAHAFLQFGPLLAASVLTIAPALRRPDMRHAATVSAYTLWIPMAPLLAWAAWAAFDGDFTAAVDDRTAGGWVTLIGYGVITWALATAFILLTWRRSPAAWPAALAATGALLLLGAELFYIRDVFAGFIPRQNTVFKLTYQAWMLLSIGGALGMAVAARRAVNRSPAAIAALAPVSVLLALGLVYPLLASMNRTDAFGAHARDGSDTAIDGLDFLQRNDPPEYALTRWVQDNTEPGDVIIEATGRTWVRDQNGLPMLSTNPGDSRVDYSDAGRIASRTGRPTPIGWYFHEIQWRGDTPANRAKLTRRQDLVDGIYIGQDPAASLEALRQLGAKYVVAGRVEQSRYGRIMAPLETFLEVAFESEGLRVYSVPEAAASR